MAARQLPARRYFAAFLAIVAGLYALVFLTGDQRTPQLGLDLQGGTTVTLAARTPDGQAPDQEDLELARQIIEQRVNGLGVAEAEVVTEGDSNIVISVPGDDGERARELGATAQLRFRPVLGGPEPAAAADPEATDPAATDPAATDPAATDPATDPESTDPAADPAATDPAATEPAVADPDAPAVTQEEAIAEYATLTCDTTTTEIDQPDSFIAACSDDGTAKFLLGPAVIEGTDVADATSGTEVGTGEWVVNLDFTSAGSAAWAEYTTANVGNNVAITLDGRVVSAPTINSAIAGGTTQITGSFDQAAATELANQLRYGALPLTFSEATAQSITTELGSEQLRAGLIAGAIGVALVFVYALLYYRLLGLVMIASLVLSAVVIYACLVLLSREIGLALSLAGIAGFIVSIGITADSFVVYFERLKDEVREGRSLRSATPRAWVRARRTILSADAVSFLAAAILYWLAIGDVKGFAFTLGLSTVLDLIVVFLFTHPLMAVLSRVKGFGSNRFSGLGQVDHSRRPAGPPRGDRELVGAATGSSTNGSNR
ncbi:protein translocase subunit SecD [Modestobacter sp. VKM Ac-2979]|uniref:protein translocase subunit SecD n=1 Tax=unclassified Modestobacter TaxID=2643866 RepID=UPI0022ABA696|nr:MULTISPECIES: protein translocase subunit SecD [unclassified Modestobacter]MCZ2812869.1 protein translocase subunit SecD [Modestobacter sp. VKM Ac-2979]MCZ2843102.1 protein translocase subunit SecD [Modestobacter sp. VKM Ac-2980]